MARAFLILGLAVIVGLTCGDCIAFGDPDVPVAATLVDGEPSLVVPLCDGESVESIEVRDTRSQDGEGPAVWRLEATRPSSTQVFVVGNVPAGFDEVIPLVSLPDRELTAVVVTSDGIELIGAVDFGTVHEGKLYVDMKPRSQSGLDGARYC